MAEVVNEIEETIDVSMSDAQFALLRGKYMPYSAWWMGTRRCCDAAEGICCPTQPGGWGHDDAAMLPREAAVIQPEGYDDSSAPVRVIYYHSTRVFDVVIAAAAVRPSERTVVFNINT